ncbi:MAG TPA: lipoprotein insertase outer membrane protein LolB [Rudaea sp.]|mgnify:FL=1|jgi:outer membrane lipoprotein LolB|nr:lipoprotein insertase outer membrane protein LolB [Rudaea sp.]
MDCRNPVAKDGIRAVWTPAIPAGVTLSRFFVSVFVMVLSACAPVRVRETPAALAAQQAREARLAPLTHWTLTAHIGVSNGGDGGSGDLAWEQNGDAFRFTVRAPVTGKTWTLSGDASHAVLEGVDPQPDTGSDPQHLLSDRLGWDVPLANLRAWVRGLRAPDSSATVQYDEHDLPAVIEQDGWKVEYRDWFADRNPPLPRKVFASRADARVRMVIENWDVDD